MISDVQSGKTSAHLFCAAPLERFSRALVGLLNEIEHDARRACVVFISFFCRTTAHGIVYQLVLDERRNIQWNQKLKIP